MPTVTGQFQQQRCQIGKVLKKAAFIEYLQLRISTLSINKTAVGAIMESWHILSCRDIFAWNSPAFLERRMGGNTTAVPNLMNCASAPPR